MVRFAVSDSIAGEDIKTIRRKLQLTQGDFAHLVNVSQKTIERWETTDKPITGPIVTLIKVLNNNIRIEDELRIPPKVYPLRLWYMHKNEKCTMIDVDERNRQVQIKNYVKDYMLMAFGKEEHPTFEQYEAFIESRCFPKSRDKMKLMLKDLDIPFYEPFLIIQKTEGRMAEDDFWIEIER